MSNAWLLLVPLVLGLAAFLAIGLCYGARKADEIAEEQRREDDDLIRRAQKWRF
jgi:hypothetical protein